MELRAARWSDLQDVYALAADLGTRLFGAPELALEHLRGDWERGGFELGHDAWVAGEAGALVGYASLAGGEEATLWLAAGSAAEHAGPALLRLVQTRAADGARKLVAIVPLADTPACAALEAEGYRKTREVWRMEIELREEPAAPVWPGGVSVRAYEPHADAPAVHALLVDAFAANAETISTFDDWLPWMTGDASFDPAVWFLAESKGRLAGVALCWNDGFVKDLAVSPAERRRGLGEALLRHAFCEFFRRGVASVSLKVDADNPTGATRLYQRVGMRTGRRYGVYTKSLEVGVVPLPESAPG